MERARTERNEQRTDHSTVAPSELKVVPMMEFHNDGDRVLLQCDASDVSGHAVSTTPGEMCLSCQEDVDELRQRLERLSADVLSSALGEVRYEPGECRRLAEQLAARLMDQLTASEGGQVPRRKYVTVVSIGSVVSRAPGPVFGCRCLWNDGKDVYSVTRFSNDSVFAVALVFALSQ